MKRNGKWVLLTFICKSFCLIVNLWKYFQFEWLWWNIGIYESILCVIKKKSWIKGKVSIRNYYNSYENFLQLILIPTNRIKKSLIHIRPVFINSQPIIKYFPQYIKFTQYITYGFNKILYFLNCLIDIDRDLFIEGFFLKNR